MKLNANRGSDKNGGCDNVLYFDGAARDNPGKSGIGFVIYDHDGKPIEQFSAFLGYKMTNNAAEYKALIAGLQHALNRGITNLTVKGDSEFVCKQVNGGNKVTKPMMRRYYNTVQPLLQKFPKRPQLEHIPRERNKAADALANQGIDRPFVDKSRPAADEIISRCATPQSTLQYISEKMCEGTLQMKFILDTIQPILPLSYAAVQELCIRIKHEIDMSDKNLLSSMPCICMCCMLAMA